MGLVQAQLNLTQITPSPVYLRRYVAVRRIACLVVLSLLTCLLSLLSQVQVWTEAAFVRSPAPQSTRHAVLSGNMPAVRTTPFATVLVTHPRLLRLPARQCPLVSVSSGSAFDFADVCIVVVC